MNFKQEQFNHATGQVLDAAIKVHSAPGPHLKLGHLPIGLMINFHVRRLKDGITRLAN